MIDVIKKWFDRVFAHEEVLILIVLLVAALLLLLKLGHVLTPIIASVIFAFIMQGMIKYFCRWGLPHPLSMFISFVIFMGGFLALLFIILPIAWRQLINLFNELPAMINQGQVLLKDLMLRYPQLVSEELVQEILAMLKAETGSMGQWLVSFSLSTIPNVMALMIYLVLVPLMVFFFLKDRVLILNWMASFLPNERPVLNKIWNEMNMQFANYIRGKVIEIIIVGVVSYIAFAILGLRYAALMGLLVGLSVLVPFIGAAVVTIPIAIVAFYQWGWGWDLLTVIIVYGVIQALDGNALVPLLFSETVDLHPVAIILAVLVFGGLWGLWGVFFAIPLATLIKAVLNAWPNVNEQKSLS